jgi:hypothetical protein
VLPEHARQKTSSQLDQAEDSRAKTLEPERFVNGTPWQDLRIKKALEWVLSLIRFGISRSQRVNRRSDQVPAKLPETDSLEFGFKFRMN